MTGYIGPIGQLAGGFQYVEGMSFAGTNNGKTADITYIGPYSGAQTFLNDHFGRWLVTLPIPPDPQTGQDLAKCGIQLLQLPKPLPTHWISGTPPDVIVDSCQFRLYPDNYRMRVTGDPNLFNPATITPSHPSCYPGGIAPPVTQPPSGTLVPFEGCSAEITITYRHKTMGAFPFPYIKQQPTSGAPIPTCLCNSATEWEQADFAKAVPDVQQGTFIEILETSPRVEFMSTPSKEFKYTDPPDSPTPGHKTGFSNGPGCQKKTNGSTKDVVGPQVPEIVDDFLPIHNNEMIIRWSNLPAIPELREFHGTVNKYQFLEYPPESVFFSGYTPTYKGNGIDFAQLVDLDLRFTIKTVNTGLATMLVSPEEIKFISRTFGIVCDRMGVWNKRWSSCPMGYSNMDPWNPNDAIWWTNWLDLSYKDSKRLLIDELNNPVQVADWTNLFTFTVT